MVNDKDIKTFKEVLKVFEKRSTCARLQVAAIIVKDGRIISTGWNGVTSGMMHCNKIFKYLKDSDREAHHHFSEINEVHSEQNAIAFAAKNGISTDNSVIFISISPCTNCAKSIVACGIKEVYYVNKYDSENSENAIQFLKNNNIKVQCIKNV